MLPKTDLLNCKNS